MSQSEDVDSDIPDRETCQKLTEQFAEITGTDEACAQFYLQDRKWDLEVRMMWHCNYKYLSTFSF
jgi:tyrosyl-DNA phosphodiesterase 2